MALSETRSHLNTKPQFIDVYCCCRSRRWWLWWWWYWWWFYCCFIRISLLLLLLSTFLCFCVYILSQWKLYYWFRRKKGMMTWNITFIITVRPTIIMMIMTFIIIHFPLSVFSTVLTKTQRINIALKLPPYPSLLDPFQPQQPIPTPSERKKTTPVQILNTSLFGGYTLIWPSRLTGN